MDRLLHRIKGKRRATPSPEPPGAAPPPVEAPTLEEAPSATTQPRPEVRGSSPADEVSLWTRASEKLKADNPALLEEYEKLLAKQLQRPQPAPSALAQDELASIAKQGLERFEEKRIKYTIFGNDCVLKDQVASASKFALKLKDIVGEALKVSPPASMAWAGVCVVLPLLTNPSTADTALTTGFTYTTSRASYYVGLEPLLWTSKSLEPGLRKELESSVAELYKKLMEFQIKSVLHFYRKSVLNLARDMVRFDDWEALLTAIKTAETALNNDLKQANDIECRIGIEKLCKEANVATSTLEKMLEVFERQLHMAEELRDDVGGLAKDVHEMKLAKDDTPIDLPVVDSARYDSAGVFEKRFGCLDGTRASFKRHIQEWANDPSGECMLFLTGPAGTGKSTLLRTLTRMFVDSKQLAGCYFFRRGEQGRNGISKLYSTIASQMSELVPGFKPLLRKSLAGTSSDSLEKRALEQQFKILLGPLRDLVSGPELSSAYVIAIDALDECEQQQDLSEALELLLNLRNLPIRFCVLLTSRKSPESTLDDIANVESHCQTLPLHKKYPEETRDDIEAYLKAEFARSKAKERFTGGPWPSEPDMELILTQATQPSPLFIYASTLCKFINATKGKAPRKQLESWLRIQRSGKVLPQLAQLYLPILYEAFGMSQDSGTEEDEWDEDMQSKLKLLVAIVYVVDPVSVPALAGLLDEDQNTIGGWLEDLHAVVSMPEDSEAPVQLLHKSFSDFLMDSGNAKLLGPFYIKKEDAHSMLSERCLWRMSHNGLAQNLAGLQHPREVFGVGWPGAENLIASDLQYAALCWVDHTVQMDSAAAASNLDSFLHTHFLHWVEARILLNTIYDAAFQVTRLTEWSRSLPNPPHRDLCNFLQDADAWMRTFVPIVAQKPLQVYLSALVFSSPTNRVRLTYWNQRLPFIRACHGLEHLAPHTGVLFNPSKDDDVVDMAFSHSGRSIASISDWGDLQVCGTRNGMPLLRFESSAPYRRNDLLWQQNKMKVMFSPDDVLIAASFIGDMVIIWDSQTGAVRRTLYLEALVSAEDPIIQNDEYPLGRWEGYSGRLVSMCFDLNSKRIAVSMPDWSIGIFHIESGVLLTSLKCRGSAQRARPGCFSNDGNLLAGYGQSYDTTWGWVNERPAVYVWQVGSGAIVMHLPAARIHAQIVGVTELPEEEPDEEPDYYDAENPQPNNQEANDQYDNVSSYLRTLKIHDVFFSLDGAALSAIISFASATHNSSYTLKASWNVVEAALIDYETVIFTPEFSYDAEVSHNKEMVVLLVPSPSSSSRVIRSMDMELYNMESGDMERSIPASNADGFVFKISSNASLLALWMGTSVRILDIAEASRDSHAPRAEEITEMSASPDGETVACGYEDGAISVRDRATGTEMCVFEPQTGRFYPFVFSPDGTLLLSFCHDDSSVWRCNVAAGTMDMVCNSTRVDYDLLRLSPDGKVLVTTQHGTLMLWDMICCELINVIWGPYDPRRSSKQDIFFSADSSDVAAITSDTTQVQIWDTRTGLRKAALPLASGVAEQAYRTDRLETIHGTFIRAEKDNEWKGLSQLSTLTLLKHSIITGMPQVMVPMCIVQAGDTLVFGLKSGEVVYIEFDLGLLAEACAEDKNEPGADGY